MPLSFPAFCDHYLLSKQLLIMYTFLNQSRIEKSWEKYLKQRQYDELPLRNHVYCILIHYKKLIKTYLDVKSLGA